VCGDLASVETWAIISEKEAEPRVAIGISFRHLCLANLKKTSAQRAFAPRKAFLRLYPVKARFQPNPNPGVCYASHHAAESCEDRFPCHPVQIGTGQIAEAGREGNLALARPCENHVVSTSDLVISDQ
jgi:hypothetical protein